jgi:hypothetical protein
MGTLDAAALDQGQNAQNQEQEPEFADGSGPLFSMYRKMAEEEDNKMAERWQKDAEGILIFVSPQFIFHTASHIKSNITDRFVLCRRRGISFGDSPGPPAKLPGYRRLLSSADLSTSS